MIIHLKLLKGKDYDIDCMSYEDDKSLNASDENNSAKLLNSNPRAHLERMNLEIGMSFNSKEEFKIIAQKVSTQTKK